MKTNPQVSTLKGTHPLFTMMLFGGIIAALVTAGSYVSKQRSVARDLQADLGALTVSFLGSSR